MLSQKYPAESLSPMLVAREQWHPFPNGSERQAWESLPGPTRQALVVGGEQHLGVAWPSLPAVRLLDFARDGNRSRYEKLTFARRRALAALVLAECVEGKARFLDDVLDGIWAICEESFWGVPAHLSLQAAGPGLPDVTEPVVDLFVAETSSLLAWTHYLLGSALDELAPLIRPRIQYEIQRRVLTPLLAREDFWWMGFGTERGRVNNWNPWINSNWLTSNLLIETDPGRRAAAVSKTMRSLDNFIDPYPPDGGCDEGPGYWSRAGASLFDCLELLYSATNAQLNVYHEPLIRNIGKYISKAQIADHYFVNFADASALVNPPATVVYGYGKRIADEELAAFGAWLARSNKAPTSTLGTTLGRRLPALFTFADIAQIPCRQPLMRDGWLKNIQVMTGRDRDGTAEGLFVAAKGGHNAESHNHNDVGNVIVYHDGCPVIVDAGVERYIRQTFGRKRYEIWTMQSRNHSLLPTVDGVMQAHGTNYVARNVEYTVTEQTAALCLDIAGAYPPDAGVVAWTRTVTLERGCEVRIEDEYELAKPIREIVLALLTPCTVERSGAQEMTLAVNALPDGCFSGQAVLLWEGDNGIEADVEQLALTDDRLQAVWGEKLTKIVFRLEQPSAKGTLRFRLRGRRASP